MRTFYGTDHVPGALDLTPMPDQNPVTSMWYNRIRNRAWWGFIYHAYRTQNLMESWTLYRDELEERTQIKNAD
jgi:hypothetical protein